MYLYFVIIYHSSQTLDFRVIIYEIISISHYYRDKYKYIKYVDTSCTLVVYQLRILQYII